MRPASEMTDIAIRNEIEELVAKWDDLQRELADSGGHSGSPGEWMQERLDELETEGRRREAAWNADSSYPAVAKEKK